MQNFRVSKPCRESIYRLFSTSSRLCKGPPYRTVDEVLEYKGPGYRIYPHKVLYKLLYKPKTKSNFIWKPPVGLPSISIQTATQVSTPSNMPISKRSDVLNKLFMRYIPEIMATSQFSDKLYGYDIQISHVKITADYRRVRVYWIPKGSEIDDEIEKLLKEVAEPLTKELVALRVMGIMPLISFHKNKFFALMAEVDRRLKIADFGENFVPTVLTEDVLKKQLQLQSTLPVETKKKIFELEVEEPVDENESTEIPSMRMNLFSLNYEKIHRTITNGMKNKRIMNLSMVDEQALLGEFCVKKVSFSVEAQRNDKLTKREFLNYLRKLRIERKKMLKNEEKEFRNKFLLESFSSDSSSNADDELYEEFVKNTFEDFIEDVDENRAKLDNK